MFNFDIAIAEFAIAVSTVHYDIVRFVLISDNFDWLGTDQVVSICFVLTLFFVHIYIVCAT